MCSFKKKGDTPRPDRGGGIPGGVANQNVMLGSLQDLKRGTDMTPSNQPLSTDQRRWFIADTASDRIRFTAAGHQALAADLAKVGIDIRQIRTRAQARAALDVLSQNHLEQLAAYAAADPKLGAILAPLFDPPETGR